MGNSMSSSSPLATDPWTCSSPSLTKMSVSDPQTSAPRRPPASSTPPWTRTTRRRIGDGLGKSQTGIVSLLTILTASLDAGSSKESMSVSPIFIARTGHSVATSLPSVRVKPDPRVNWVGPGGCTPSPTRTPSSSTSAVTFSEYPQMHLAPQNPGS